MDLIPGPAPAARFEEYFHRQPRTFSQLLKAAFGLQFGVQSFV